MNQSQEIEKLSAAFIKAQSEFPPVPKSGRHKHFGYTYSTLDDIIKATEPTLKKFGLALMAEAGNPVQLPNDRINVTLTGRLLHESGQWVEASCVGEGQDTGDKATYKAITGGRKYLYCSLLGLTTDDDPETVRENRPATPPMAQHEDHYDRPASIRPSVSTPRPLSIPVNPVATPPQSAESAEQDPVLAQFGLKMEKVQSGKWTNYNVSTLNGKYVSKVVAPEILDAHVRATTDAPNRMKGIYLRGGIVSFNDEAYQDFLGTLHQAAGEEPPALIRALLAPEDDEVGMSELPF